MKYLLLFLLFICSSFSIAQSYPYTHLVTNITDQLIYTNEPSVAVNNNNLIVGTNYNNGSTINRVGVFYSSDNGQNWSNGIMPKGFSGNSTDDSDPSVSYDGLGNAYYVYLSEYSNSTGIFINKSTNGGAYWMSNSVEVISENQENYIIDKPYVFIHKSGIEYENKIFIAYYYEDLNNIQIRLMIGNVNTLQFSGPYVVASISNTADNYLQGPVPLFHSTSSSIFIAYTEKLNNQFNIKVARSTDGGINYLTPVNVASNVQHIGTYDVEGDKYYLGSWHNKFRVNNFPSITIIGDNIYVAFAEKLNGYDKITISKSTNFGSSFSKLNQLDFYGNFNFFPWITFAPDNKLVLVYQSMANSIDPIVYTRLYLLKDDAIIEDAALDLDNFDYVSCFTTQIRFLGDYLNVTSDDNYIYSVFTSKNQNIIGTSTAIKMGKIPNKINLSLKAFADQTPISSEVTIDQTPYQIPVQGLNFNNPFTFQSNTYLASGILQGYKFRHWQITGSTVFDNPLFNSFPHSPPLSPISLDIKFYPTQPLTVINNLEGGNGGTYKVTWDKKSNETQTISSGQSYYAFEYNQALQDVFTLEVQDFSALNTNWNFLNWSDDLQSSTRIEAITANNKNFTAIYKGHFRSDNSSAYTSNSQQKTIRDNAGYYHTVYISMGIPWYTKSVTTDFGGEWTQEDEPIMPYDGVAKNPSLDFYGDNLLVVFEYSQTEGTFLQLVMINMLTGSINLEYDRTSLPSSFFGNAKPVIAYTNGEIYVAYKESTSSTLKFWRKYVNGTGGWVTETGNIPYTSSNSINVTLANRDNIPGTNDIHIAWQERTTTGTANSIKYLYSWLSGTVRSYLSTSLATISSKSGFIHNLNPSISLYSNIYPIVTWTGREDEGPASRTVIRPKSSTLWGSYLITGSNVGNTVNQSVTGSDNTLIAWTENISTTKYARRINALYSCVGSELSHYGTDISLSGGNSLSQIKALVFKGTGTLPYLINKNIIDFSANCIFTEQALSKITENDTIVTFGRSGIVSINDIEFIFEIGDILVGDSIIKFIEIPDTLAYPSTIELNQHTRTNNFTLSPSTNFYFSNIYHVVQKSNPDTALTTLDAVNFKAELVNANTNQVTGTFDNITYNKNNLDKYANIDYEVDCSGITAGEYYLRLVTSVNGNTSYALSNIYNLNTTLAKKNFNQVNFTGSEIPTTYALAQNYPNPFNPSTTIHYQIPQDGIVTLKIYDILGSEVATLVNEEKVVGKYEVNFNASALASGVYIYKIQAGSFINSKKMILLK